MKLSKGYWQTLKETPSDAEVISHQLMLRAGLIHKTGSGLYTYLPMGLKVLRKVEAIIREELDRIHCHEVAMPIVTPGELWRESGRLDAMGGQMLMAKDRAERVLCISPTNEEAVTDVFRQTVTSYKQLPVCLYQINTKFRDEIRPRFGVMRAREFLMKDAYSFHLTEECLDEFYDKIFKAYENIFKRLGLEFIAVEADGGTMAAGGAKTHEFQVVAENGEDLVVTAQKQGISCNIETAVTTRKNIEFSTARELFKIETPSQKTCEEVCHAQDIPLTQSLKSIFLKALIKNKEQFFMAVLLGDDSMNEVKLKNKLQALNIQLATDKELLEFGLVKGFIGPIKNGAFKVIYDSAINLEASYIIGANEENFHFKGFVPKRDTTEKFFQADIRLAKEGDFIGDEEIVLKKGIEVGHIFQLGDKYTKSMKVSVQNNKGQNVTPLMGCYGIGISRIIAAAIEQSHDENGIIWPPSLAPYDVYLGFIGKSEEVIEFAETVYQEGVNGGLSILFDDRKLGPGQMFKDADLSGIPLRVIIGEKTLRESEEVEIKVRKTNQVLKVHKNEILSTVQRLLNEQGN